MSRRLIRPERNRLIEKVFHRTASKHVRLLEVELDASEAKRRIIRFIKEKVEASHADGVVFELSGDCDSAVTAYLCVEALGARRAMGLVLPDLRLASEKDLKDAGKVAEELCLESKQIDIAPIHKTFMKNLNENGLAEDNLRTRIRMSLLYYHANTMNRLVVGSTNKSDMLMGYFAKYGDGGADIFPIGDLYESNVRLLGEVLGINRLVIAKPARNRSAMGWRPSLEGIDHETADRILELKVGQGLDAAVIASRLRITRAKVDSVISRYQESSHKRLGSEVCVLR